MNDLSAVPVEAVNAFLKSLEDADIPEISRVLIYGSRARGDHHEESDLDIAIVFRGKPPAKRQTIRDEIRRKSIEARFTFGFVVSPQALWEDSLAHPERMPNAGFYRDVNRDAIEWTSGASN